MKIKKILVTTGLLLVGVLIIPVLNSCKSCTTSSRSDTEESITTSSNFSDQYPEESVQRPDEVRVVVDKSGSMKGYFNQADMQPMMAAIETMRDLGVREGSLQFFGDSKPFPSGSKAASILAASKFDKDTDMSNLISGCIKLGGDTVPVALITDGIVSTPQGKNDLPQMERNIKRTLEEKSTNLGWVIFRGESKYNGTYYVEAQRPVAYPKGTLKADERPFYIVVIGPKAEIRYIVSQAQKNEEDWDKSWDCEWVAFNTHDDHTNLQFFAMDNAYFVEGTGGYKWEKKDQNIKIPLCFYYPTCLHQRVKDLKPSNATLELNGNVIKGWKSSIGGGKTDRYVQIDIPGEGLYENLQAENILTLIFSTLPDQKWSEEYSSDDDSTIFTDSDQQEKTYELKSLLKPMGDASSNNEVKVTFKFSE